MYLSHCRPISPETNSLINSRNINDRYLCFATVTKRIKLSKLPISSLVKVIFKCYGKTVNAAHWPTNCHYFRRFNLYCQEKLMKPILNLSLLIDVHWWGFFAKLMCCSRVNSIKIFAIEIVLRVAGAIITAYSYYLAPNIVKNILFSFN